RIFAESYLAIVLAVLYLPILVIIVFSFTNNANFSFANGFTLEAYTSIFTSEKTPALLDALKNTPKCVV
ncbi:MAG: ABC transporter permease, partial [Bacteroidaceae bacterium]|nr:ABC transporter permease [Bacteroidaceae bacterium]